MIIECNRIDPENDSVEVIKAKIKAIKQAVDNGEASAEEMEAEKAKLEAAQRNGVKVGYAFNW